MELLQNIPCLPMPSVAAWRSWLAANHASEKNLFLIIYHKESGVSSVYYPDAVDEALCFGWVDSTPKKRDEQSYYVLFARRNPKSLWSAVNKAKVERLMAEGRMAEAGLQMVALAKETGTWTALDGVSALELPEDLVQAFVNEPQARVYFEAFPPSARRGILEWIFTAKRPETRAQRIAETVRLAAQNERANQWKKPG